MAFYEQLRLRHVPSVAQVTGGAGNGDAAAEMEEENVIQSSPASIQSGAFPGQRAQQAGDGTDDDDLHDGTSTSTALVRNSGDGEDEDCTTTLCRSRRRRLNDG